jgi:peptidyl-tRNA hydrolase, PTH1 family
LKYLIAGLGNIGPEYVNTRHNIGFDILDQLVATKGVQFETKRLADYALFKFKGRQFHLIKPATFMNLSGKSVKYWMTTLKITPDNLLIVVDDIALPLGRLRLRAKGGDGGHNGLKNINETLGNSKYARLRFGVGNDFYTGSQTNYVLGKFSEQEREIIQPKIKLAGEIILNFGTIGLTRTMTQFNSN